MPTDCIPLTDLQRITRPFLAFADVLSERRTLLIAERRSVRWLLVAFENAVRKLDATSLGIHGSLLDKLRRILGTPESSCWPRRDYTLDDLKDMTVPFLKFADALGRPLTQNERRAFRWLLVAWEGPAIKAEFVAMDEEALTFFTDRMVQLRDVLIPDPIRVRRLQRVKGERVIELCPGNFTPKNPPMRGVSDRRLDHAEASQFVALMAKMCRGLGVLARVLSLVRQADGEEAKQIVRAANRIGRMGDAFAARCSPLKIPVEPSMQEITEQCRLMAELMKPAPTEQHGGGEGENVAA